MPSSCSHWWFVLLPPVLDILGLQNLMAGSALALIRLVSGVLALLFIVWGPEVKTLF
jgi:hypothetical protein